MHWWVLKRQIHISWLIAVFSISFSLGVFVSQYFGSGIGWPLVLFLTLIVIGFCVAYRWVAMLPLVVICGITIGIFRGSFIMNSLFEYSNIYNKQVTVYGIVSDDIDGGESSNISLRLGQITHDDVMLPGEFWISGYGDSIGKGDAIEVSGKLLKGFGNFAGVMYHAKIQMRHKSNDPMLGIRNSFANQVSQYVTQPESSLGIGFLVGMKRDLPFDLEQALKIAGLTHIVVASGYNLTVLVRLSRRLFEKISKYIATSMSLALTVAFVSIAGLSPSMVRAGLVTTLCLLAWYYGRKFHPVVLLSFVMALTLAINPIYAWGDLGWQLSFAAFFGVMILAPLVQKYLFDDKNAPFVVQILVETLSAFVATLPILIAAFGQISNVAIISNLLVLPFVPLAMLLTFLTGIFGYFLPIFAVVIGQAASWLLGYMVEVTKTLSGLEWATSVVVIDDIGVVVFYFVILAVCWYLWRVTGYDLRDANLVE